MRVNKTKYFLVVGVLLAIAGVTLGFAAFSNTLIISSSATVTPDASTFSVKFSSSGTELLENSIEPDIYYAEAITSIPIATNATINNVGNPKLTNISVTLTEPGQSVMYYFYVHNAGEYKAYSDIDASTSTPTVTCTIPKGSTATPSLVEQACHGIAVQYVGTHYELEPGEFVNEFFVIDYADVAVRADGPFNVNIGDIELVYTSANPDA